MRMGRTFVAVPDKLAEAIAYAADRGAASTVMATGALGNTPAMRDAIEYADSKDVVQCVAIGNEDSRHHHFPQIYQDVIPVTGIKPDPATSYSARWDGSNFGAHAVVAAPTFVWTTKLGGGYEVDGGTSSSVPHCAAVAALVVSRARDLGLSLSARQVRDILMETADRASEFTADFGFGRLNARAAVEAVGAPRPPDARITAPSWYHDFTSGPIAVGLDVRTAGAAPTLEMGYGVAPTNWTMVLGTSVNPVPPPLAGDPLDDSAGNAYAVTLRLTTTGSAGTVAVDRRTFFVHDDPGLVPGFPLDVGASAEGSPLLVDLDGDNRAEILLGTSDGRVHAWDHAGHVFPGWPVALDPSPTAHGAAAAYNAGGLATPGATIFSGLAAGDLDGDGLPEVVATALDGKVYAFHGDGSRVAGFPVDLHSPIWASPTLADFDGAGRLSIVVGTYARSVHVLDGSAHERAGFPVSALDPSATSAIAGLIAAPAVGDLDGDGVLDIVIGTTESSGSTLSARGRVYAFHANGAAFSGFPVEPWALTPETFPVVGSGVPNQPLLVDLDGDGKQEIVVGSAAGQIAAFDATGRALRGFDHGEFVDGLSPFGPPRASADPRWQVNLLLLAQPIAADLANSGRPDVIAGTMGLPVADISALGGDSGEALVSLSSLLTVWKRDGHVRAPFPRRLEGWTLFQASTVADLDGDSLPEVIVASDGGWIHAWNARGDEAPGFPRFAGGWLTNVAVGDLDGDGKNELVTATREGQVFAWTTGAPGCLNGESAARWPMVHHDAHNSGSISTDAVAPAAVADAHVADGRVEFTAVGDDGFSGAAASYDARWSASPILTAAEFAAATPIAVHDAPEAGHVVRSDAGVPPGSFVAVRAKDRAGNVSPVAPAGAAIAIACASGPVIHLDGARTRGCGCDLAATARSSSASSLAPLMLLAAALLAGVRQR
ncbi:MAG TPA: FG-GAP-like repeat-containing protein, partial [bacterium]|nr:FG-GAP-like repeat-containing protein [bacterium]